MSQYSLVRVIIVLKLWLESININNNDRAASSAYDNNPPTSSRR